MAADTQTGRIKAHGTSNPVYGIFAILAGTLVTVMSGINSRFSEIAGSVVSVLVIHASGLAAILVVSALVKQKSIPGRIPAYMYLGGVIGVSTVFASNFAFSAIGASLTIAIALLGQTMFSVAADATGLLGRTKYPLSCRRIPGIVLVLAGIAVMSGAWRANLPAMFLSLGGGVSVGFSAVLNSQLGTRKGILHSTRANYATGLVTAALIFAAVRLPVPGILEAISTAGPVLALSGGIMGIVVVIAINLVMPRLPVFTATILMFAGQTVAGIFLDALRDGVIDPKKIAGTAILIVGLVVDTVLAQSSA
jgi:transporter family-2 protein